MFTRRDFLTRTLGGSSLLAVGSAVPGFLANTALAADKAPKAKAKDTILVVVEMEGGNDGLNTLAPYADDLYQKARPTLGFAKKEVLKINDHVGLHPKMTDLKRLYDEQKLAIVQDAVSHHMYYHKPGATPEAIVLRDADTLDFLGAVGVARVL